MILVLQIAAGVSLGIVGGAFAIVGLVEARYQVQRWRWLHAESWFAERIAERQPK